MKSFLIKNDDVYELLHLEKNMFVFGKNGQQLSIINFKSYDIDIFYFFIKQAFERLLADPNLEFIEILGQSKEILHELTYIVLSARTSVFHMFYGIVQNEKLVIKRCEWNP